MLAAIAAADCDPAELQSNAALTRGKRQLRKTDEVQPDSQSGRARAVRPKVVAGAGVMGAPPMGCRPFVRRGSAAGSPGCRTRLTVTYFCFTAVAHPPAPIIRWSAGREVRTLEENGLRREVSSMARSTGQNSRRIRDQLQSRNDWTKSARDTGWTYGRGGGPSFKGGSRAR